MIEIIQGEDKTIVCNLFVDQVALVISGGATVTAQLSSNNNPILATDKTLTDTAPADFANGIVAVPLDPTETNAIDVGQYEVEVRVDDTGVVTKLISSSKVTIRDSSMT